MLALGPAAWAQEMPQASDPFLRAVQDDVDWLGSYRTRVIGSAEHAAMAAELEAKVRAIPGVQVWVHEFEITVPVYGPASLEIAGGPAGRHEVFPLWPNGARLNITGEAGIAGDLVYIGEGTINDIPAAALDGQIAVMEADSKDNWMNAGAFGAKAIVYLGSNRMTNADARQQILMYPMAIPRFYLPEGAAADALRTGAAASGTVRAEGNWETVTGRNVYALVVPETAKGKKAFVCAAQMDAMAHAPGLAQGADAAVDAAVALNLLREMAQETEVGNGPVRPWLFAFLDGYSIYMRGMREMLAGLAIPEEERERYIESDEKLLEAYEEAAAYVDELGPPEEAVYRLYRSEYESLLDYVRHVSALRLVDIDYEIQPLRLEADEAEGARKEELQARVDALAEERTNLNAVRTQLTLPPKRPLGPRIKGWFGLRTAAEEADTERADLNPELKPLAIRLYEQARQRALTQLEELRERIAYREMRRGMRLEICRALGLPEDEEVPIQFMLGIELSDAGIAVGPLIADGLTGQFDQENAEAFLSWLATVYQQEREAIWPLDQLRALSMEPRTTADLQHSFFIGPYALFTSPSIGFAIPSMSWSTLDSYRIKVDTPRDTVANLRWERLTPQIGVTRGLVRRLAKDADFDPQPQNEPKWTHVTGSVVNQAPGEPLPNVPEAGYLVGLYPGSAQQGRFGVNYRKGDLVGVRLDQYTFSGSNGTFLFRDMPGTTSSPAWMGPVFFMAFKFGADGAITDASDLNTSGTGGTYSTNVNSPRSRSLRGVVFPCREMNAFHLYDPRFINPLMGASMLDALRGSEPKRMSLTVVNGMASALLMPDAEWQMILRNGVTSNRMLLLNVNQDLLAEGESLQASLDGFPLGTSLQVHPVEAAARDMFAVDNSRLRNYRRAGITSRSLDEVQARTQEYLKQADEARGGEAAGAGFYAASGALANEVRGYEAVRSLGNDVVRAAVLLLLALIPFAFAMERLLFANAKVHHQILTTLGIFAAMTAILWSFHPAFRITSQPLVIIMAFGIIFLSLLVISLVVLKFKNQIEEMKSDRAESSGAKTSQLGLISTAVKLGIANMRKRKLRTALTGITVVLITFALMAFTSTSTWSGEKRFALETGKDVFSPVVLVRQPAIRIIPEKTPEYIANIVAHMSVSDDPDDTRKGSDVIEAIAERWWWQEPSQPSWRIHVRNPQGAIPPADGKTGPDDTVIQVSLPAALGIEAAEESFTAVRDVLPNWDRFAELAEAYPETQRAGGYLAADTAARLGVSPGDTMIIAGRDVELVGVYDPKRFEAELYALDGSSLSPIDYQSMGSDQRNEMFSTAVDMLATQMESGQGMEANLDLPHVPAAQLAVLPAAMLRGIENTSLRNIMLRGVDAAAVRQVASRFVDRFAFPIYFGSPEEGVSVLAKTPLLPKAPRSLLILVVLAGLIIFNTMMSSIAERKREIYIYTSLGLAPFHIGVLFLTEAITYGLMGSIFGYIIGQGVATFLSEFGLLGGLTLNYSGTQTVATMAMVLGIVIISSLIPAYLAGRLAVPSNEMTWRVPDPENGVIHDSLPFTLTNRTANGTIAYLQDYFDAHREGSIGHFTTDQCEVFRLGREETGGIDVLGLRGTVWLAPYDLSVRQDFEIRVHQVPNEEDVLGIDIILKHGSGQPENWIKLNKTFMGDLRRQLLGWRSLKVERVLGYIEQADTMLERLPA